MARASGAVEYQEPRSAARRRILRNQLSGKFEREIGDVHEEDEIGNAEIVKHWR